VEVLEMMRFELIVPFEKLAAIRKLKKRKRKILCKEY